MLPRIIGSAAKAEPTMQGSFRTGALAAVVLTLGLSACGGGGSDVSEDDIKARVADQLSTDGGLDADTAECFAGVLVDEIGADELEDVDFAAEEPPAGLQDDIASAAAQAIETCDVDVDSLEE
jgi:hypothetical protein